MVFIELSTPSLTKVGQMPGASEKLIGEVIGFAKQNNGDSRLFVGRMMGYIGDFRSSNWCRFFSVVMGKSGCCPSVWWFLLGWRDIDFRSRGRICWPFPSQVGRSILVGACGSLLLRWYNLGTDVFFAMLGTKSWLPAWFTIAIICLICFKEPAELMCFFH